MLSLPRYNLIFLAILWPYRCIGSFDITIPQYNLTVCHCFDFFRAEQTYMYTIHVAHTCTVKMLTKFEPFFKH